MVVLHQAVWFLLSRFLKTSLCGLVAILICLQSAHAQSNDASAVPPPAANIGQAVVPSQKAVPQSPSDTQSKIVNNPFLQGGVTDLRDGKTGISREEILHLMQQMETRLGDQINLQSAAQQSVDTEQLTNLLGSLSKTEGLDDMVFIGCVNGKAAYRNKDGATTIVDEKSNSKSAGKKSIVVNRCQ